MLPQMKTKRAILSKLAGRGAGGRGEGSIGGISWYVIQRKRNLAIHKMDSNTDTSPT